jgi:hypothetical protein
MPFRKLSFARLLFVFHIICEITCSVYILEDIGAWFSLCIIARSKKNFMRFTLVIDMIWVIFLIFVLDLSTSCQCNHSAIVRSGWCLVAMTSCATEDAVLDDQKFTKSTYRKLQDYLS